MSHTAALLPAHERQFHPNVTFGITRGGCLSFVNVFNYYNTTSLPGVAQQDSAAIAEVSFYDPNGKLRFLDRERLEPFGSLHLDLGSRLRAAGGDGETYGAVLCRLIPETLPPSFADKVVSTEYIVEVASPSGSRSIVHNVGSVVYGPNLEIITSEQVFCDARTCSSYVTLLNNYHGPRLPFVGRGRSYVVVTNHRGESIASWSESVPPRGTRLFSFHEHFPDLRKFLDGQAGTIRLESYNLIRKPLTWVVSPLDQTTVSINHI